MSETPDFDAIALKLTDALDPTDVPQGRAAIAEALRLVWNARGAADVVAIRGRMSTLTGWLASEPYLQHVAEAVAEIDR